MYSPAFAKVHADAPASLRGRRLYVKGLPYGWGREAIRQR